MIELMVIHNNVQKGFVYKHDGYWSGNYYGRSIDGRKREFAIEKCSGDIQDIIEHVIQSHDKESCYARSA